MQKSLEIIYKRPKLVVFNIFFSHGIIVKDIFSCDYPFRSVQKLRIFGKGEKIRNVQNTPVKLIKVCLNTSGNLHSRVICESAVSVTDHLLQPSCLQNKQANEWQQLISKVSCSMQHIILIFLSRECRLSNSFPIGLLTLISSMMYLKGIYINNSNIYKFH